MRTYFLSVIAVAVFGGICEELLPEKNAARPHVRLVTGLCVLLVLILPVKDALGSLGALFGSLSLEEILGEEGSEEGYESIFDAILSDYTREEAERIIGAELTEALGLREGTCRAEITVGESGELLRVKVFVTGGAVLESPYGIEELVNERYGCPCDVVVGR